MERSRELWIDVLKGIAIVCVILGHTFIYGDRVYYFHMPLFFLIGGYLFKRGQSWMHLLRKTTKRIVFPFIVYLLVLYLLTPFPPFLWCMLGGGGMSERGVWRCLVLSCVFFFIITFMVHSQEIIRKACRCATLIYSVFCNA